LWKTLTMTHTAVFCSCSKKVEWLAGCLKNEGYDVLFIHSDMPRARREAVLEEFRLSTGCPPVLIIGEIRGLHLEKVQVTINYDLPPYREGYIRRCGRYFNRKAVAINFMLPRDVRYLEEIKRFYDASMVDLPHAEIAELAFEIFKII